MRVTEKSLDTLSKIAAPDFSKLSWNCKKH